MSLMIIIIVKHFPADDELGTCRTSLVFPQQSVLRIYVRSTYSTALTITQNELALPLQHVPTQQNVVECLQCSRQGCTSALAVGVYRNALQVPEGSANRWGIEQQPCSHSTNWHGCLHNGIGCNLGLQCGHASLPAPPSVAGPIGTA